MHGGGTMELQWRCEVPQLSVVKTVVTLLILYTRISVSEECAASVF